MEKTELIDRFYNALNNPYRQFKPETRIFCSISSVLELLFSLFSFFFSDTSLRQFIQQRCSLRLCLVDLSFILTHILEIHGTGWILSSLL